MRYAEVIGDPITQSKSPIIHNYWLEQLGLTGQYRRTHVPTGDLAAFLEERKNDPDWRGCNVTIPHKQEVTALVDRIERDAQLVGAVNCIVPQAGALIGHNTDLDGVAAALRSAEIRERKVVVIGAGGAARALVAYLAAHGVGMLAILARRPDRAIGLEGFLPNQSVRILRFDEAEAAFSGASVIVNASPLGMAGAEPMPRAALDALAGHEAGATVFDMVTTPTRTQFLALAEAGGARVVDGLTMLVGQARRAFELFFDVPAPPPDQKLRCLLAANSRDNAEWDTKSPKSIDNNA